MKQIIVGIAVLASGISACNTNKSESSSSEITKSDTAQVATNPTTPQAEAMGADTSLQEVIAHYLDMKNALAGDKTKEAAAAGKAVVVAIGKMDHNSLSADKKKVWTGVSDDAKEHAEHIGDNADKIAHQREHFDMLSTDMYEMVKVFGAERTLYKDSCPMFNNSKGAIWLSEVKEIKNPYYGKKMSTCGSMKEELK